MKIFNLNKFEVRHAKYRIDKFHAVQKYKSDDEANKQLQNSKKPNGLWVVLNPLKCYYVIGKVPNRIKVDLVIRGEQRQMIPYLSRDNRLSNEKLNELVIIPEDGDIKTEYKKLKIIQISTGKRLNAKN